MPLARRAVIDVGTNSVKLLVAEISDGEVRPVWEGSKQTRLGRGLYQERRLQPEPIAKTARAVARFATLARAHEVESLRVIATSAAREASNASELIAAIESAAEVRVEIISGDLEADWAFQGVTSDPALATTPLLLLDVGGGSTEVILGHGSNRSFRQSFPIGTVRMLDRFPHSDPPEPAQLAACREWLAGFLRREVQPTLDRAIRDEIPAADGSPLLLVGCGGTASILARIERRLQEYDRQLIDATRLSLAGLQDHVDRLWGLPLEERRVIRGMPPKRADVILPGILVYEAFMEQFAFKELRITSRGLRFGAVM